MGSTMVAICSFGKKPSGINRAVIIPQAMKAPILGIIIEDKKVPNFCTPTRSPLFCGADVVVDKGEYSQCNLYYVEQHYCAL